jgi:hypothetical protein
VFHRTSWLVAVAAVLVGTVAARAETKPNTAADAKALAARIDEHIAAGWGDHKAKPAKPADDGTFLRRVYLDLVGQTPPLSEARDFLDDPEADKRSRLVERLLATDAHARHLATTWRRFMAPNVEPASRAGLDLWLQRQVRDNVGYDKIVHEILAGALGTMPFAQFATANENKPENMAASAARVFLGVRLECAQCHDHPFAKWKKDQYWEFAAFFSQGKLKVPNKDKVAKARLLVGDTPPLKEDADQRGVLANWITHADNPFFAKAAVNRLWLQFFGIGLVDPVDGVGEDQPPSHPDLLNELAREFAAHQFDVRFLIKAMVMSKTYALSSETTEKSQDDARVFARSAVRGLSPEQLYDSLAVVTGKMAPVARGSSETLPSNSFGQRDEFLERFTTPGTPLEAEASILQALHLMNGKPMADGTSLEGNRLLKTLANAEGLTTARRIEELYLLTLARKPRTEESARLVKHVDSHADKKKALADVFWVLLNSSEFALNH